jgi:hypothetical protein
MSCKGDWNKQEEKATTDLKWENLLGLERIEGPANIITTTMKNLPPPISIYQYYQSYKPNILKWSNLPDLKARSQFSKEEFQILWNQANSAEKDTLTFMWVLKDLTVPKGVI